MSTQKITLDDDVELTKNYVTNSTMSDEYKKLYLRLINISTIAINGISSEEKIQKMTECIQLLAITQGMYLSNIDTKIQKAIEQSNSKMCNNCKAIQHVEEAEEEQQQNALLESYLKKHGITNAQDAANASKNEKLAWMDVVKTILTKPYLYVVLSLMMISPYSIEIVKVICNVFAK